MLLPQRVWVFRSWVRIRWPFRLLHILHQIRQLPWGCTITNLPSNMRFLCHLQAGQPSLRVLICRHLLLCPLRISILAIQVYLLHHSNTSCIHRTPFRNIMWTTAMARQASDKDLAVTFLMHHIVCLLFACGVARGVLRSLGPLYFNLICRIIFLSLCSKRYPDTLNDVLSCIPP